MRTQLSEIKLDLTRVLGKGSFGTVYRATYAGAACACKVQTVDPQNTLDLILDEVAIQGRLHHRNVVPLLSYAIYTEEGKMKVAVVQPLMALGLDKLCARKAVSTFAERLRILRDVCDGLTYIHSPEVDVVHCDIKPANILLAADGAALITDFGISRAHARNDATAKGVGHTGGTLDYQCPFVLSGDHVNHRSSDIWSLCVPPPPLPPLPS